MKLRHLAALVVVVTNVALVAGPAAAAEPAPRYVSAGIYVMPVRPVTAASSSALRREDPVPEPALTIFAADAPRPVDATRARALTLAGRLYAPAEGTGRVRLRELPWTLDRSSGAMQVAVAVALRNRAAAIKVAVRGEELVVPLTVRFVGGADDMTRILDAPTVLAPSDHRLAWSSTMSGAALTMVLTRRVGAPIGDGEQLRIEQIAEVLLGGDDAERTTNAAARAKTASVCFRDVACETGFDAASAGVVLLEIATADALYQCTGALLRASDDGTQRAVVVTAGHCLADATGVTAYFGYRSLTCNGPSPSPLTLQRRTQLAPFLVGGDLDFGLVDFPGPVPAGATLLGWSAAPLTVGDELVALHHALGGTQGVFPVRVAALSYPFMIGPGQILELPLYEGTGPESGIAGGASGAPLINVAGQVRGIATAAVGTAQQCSDGQAYAARIAGPEFARVYPAIADYLNGVVPPPPPAREEGDLRSVGGLSYSLLTGNQLRFVVDRIENTSATAPTGMLRVTACATEAKESTTCLPLWQVSRDALPAGGSYEPLSITESYSPPPAGTYYLRFVIEEIETVGPRLILLAHSAQTETWVPPPPKRVCVKYKKGVCKKWKTL